MTFVIDVGNTNIVCGVYKNDILIWHSRFKTDSSRTSDEYYALLSSLKTDVWEVQNISKIAIASVVPELTRIWLHLVRKHFKIDAKVINGESELGLTFLVDEPCFIGADLIVNAFAGLKKYQTNCLIVDLGTATTIQLVTSEGLFKGAIIAPGLKTAAEMLFSKAALLSSITLTTPSSILGLNTNDAILSGAVKGHAIMIEGFIKEITSQHKIMNDLKIILTGGVSDLLCSLIDSIDVVDKTLTLDGLYLASQYLDVNEAVRTNA